MQPPPQQCAPQFVQRPATPPQQVPWQPPPPPRQQSQWQSPPPQQVPPVCQPSPLSHISQNITPLPSWPTNDKEFTQALRDLQIDAEHPLYHCVWDSDFIKLGYWSVSKEVRAKMQMLTVRYTLDFLKGLRTVQKPNKEIAPLSGATAPKATKVDASTTAMPTLNWGAPRPCPSGTMLCVLRMDTLDALTEIKRIYSYVKVITMVMGNPKFQCGGNWLSGGIAQEESIYTRTNISTAQGPYFYPIKPSELLFAEGVTVIRHGADKGFAFIEPFERTRADFVTVTARNLKSTNGSYTGEVKIDTRNKIENFLSFCAHHNPGGTLVLGAFGCGKFLHPPPAVAAIYKALLTEYAGWFSKVYFVILNSQMADTFAEVLLGAGRTASRTVMESQQEYETYHVWNGEHFWEPQYVQGDREQCPDGGECKHTKDAAHMKKFWHPPHCKDGDACKDTTDMHRFLFTHKLRCKDYTACELYFTDPSHKAEFLHAPECPKQGLCTDVSRTHTQEYTHVPCCPDGVKCSQLGDMAHKMKFRHIVSPCPEGSFCMRFMDPQHRAEFSHPFVEPCPDTPFACSKVAGGSKDEEHMKQHSHLCWYGKKCKDLDKPEHTRYWIHASAPCKDGSECKELSEDHNGACMHPRAKGYRVLCRNRWCQDYSLDHRQQFAHYVIDPAFSKVIMINVHDPKADDKKAYGDFGVDTMWHMDAEANARQAIAACDKYAPVRTDTERFKAIEDWFRKMRPVHMCFADVFLSMINLGGITSHRILESLWEDSREFQQTLMTHNRVVALHIDSAVKEKFRKYSKLYTRVKQAEMKEDLVKRAVAIHDPNDPKKDLTVVIAIFSNTSPASDDDKTNRSQNRSALVQLAGEDTVKKFEGIIDALLKDISNIMMNCPGIGSSIDINPRTNYTAFAVIGQHNHDYGKSEVVLVFRKEIMFHPDYFDLPVAACMYVNGEQNRGNWGASRSYIKRSLNRVPWRGNGKPWDGGGSEDYFTNKVHPTAPSYYEAIAKEWVCRVKLECKKSPEDVTVEDIRELWNGYNAHYVTEGHLPGRTPLDYVQHIILQKSAYDKICASKHGKATLDRWTKYYGANFMEIVPGPEDVNKASGDYLATLPPHTVDEPYGFCFVCNNTQSERFLPFHLSDKNCVRLTFMAHSEVPFFATLSNVGDIQGENKVSFTFRIGDQVNDASTSPYPVTAYHSNPSSSSSAKIIDRDPDFNAGCPVNLFVHYVLTLDYTSGTATLSHWGPSAVYNDRSLKVSFKKSIRYSYVSFTCIHGSSDNVAIWNVCEVPNDPNDQLPREQILGKFGLASDKRGSNVKKASPSPAGSPTQSPAPPNPSPQPPSPTPPRRLTTHPLCKTPFFCDDTSDAHKGQYSHICRYGRGCKDINDQAHCLKFCHLDKPPCDKGAKCDKLQNPKHRRKYYHKGLEDFMRECKDGTKCTDTSEAHRTKFCHQKSKKLLFSKSKFTPSANESDIIEEVV